MPGPCLCGDTHCPSCGPAQGNSKCMACGEWMDDHDEHIDMHQHSAACYEPNFPGKPVCGIDECRHNDERCAAESAALALAEAESEDLMDQYYADAQKAMDYVHPIQVILTCSKEHVDESTVETENIEEDMTGRDILTFKCPQCGESHRSLRLG